MVRGGVDCEAAPPAADVEYALAGAEPELAADEFELGLLGLLERLRTACEVRAAVGHRAVEEQLEELVADVVVVLDRAAIAEQRMALAAQSQFGRRRSRRQHQPARADQRDRQPRLLGERQSRRLERVDHQ